jgi:molybdopterin synthase sulfur carrier subunit
MHLETGATVHDIVQKVLCTYPAMLPLQNSLLIARNHEYATPSELLQDGDVVDVMPPVSGG